MSHSRCEKRDQKITFGILLITQCFMVFLLFQLVVLSLDFFYFGPTISILICRSSHSISKLSKLECAQKYIIKRRITYYLLLFPSSGCRYWLSNNFHRRFKCKRASMAPHTICKQLLTNHNTAAGR